MIEDTTGYVCIYIYNITLNMWGNVGDIVWMFGWMRLEFITSWLSSDPRSSSVLQSLRTFHAGILQDPERRSPLLCLAGFTKTQCVLENQ